MPWHEQKAFGYRFSDRQTGATLDVELHIGAILPWSPDL
jgi:hypothetical protein